MSKETNHFIREGIQKYKQATNTYFSFRKELQNKLQFILKNHKTWGKLKPNFKSVKSTTFGQDYPLLNARINCDFNTEKLVLVIGVNWYQSESDFPFFTVWLEKDNTFFNIQEQFTWNPPYKYEERSLRYFPNQDDYDLKKDFEGLLNEFIRFYNKND